MADNRCAHEGSEVLLVEGPNDCHVVLALCGHHKVPENFGIYSCGSDYRALRRMNALIASPSPPSVLGLVVDADSPDVAGRWESIRQKLSQYGYMFPDVPNPGGTIIDAVEAFPRLGFWLMPNNQDPGMLEDFCLEMIADEAKTVVNQCIGVAEANECTTFKAVHRSKAVVHTFLAWQDEPGKPLGQSITAQVLRPDTVTAQSFAAWLTTLFQSVDGLL